MVKKRLQNTGDKKPKLGETKFVAMKTNQQLRTEEG
jgi:hypothetical protein